MIRNPLSDTRVAVLAMLAGVLDRGLNMSESESLIRQSNGRDRSFSRHLCYGVLRWYGALDWLAGQMLRKPLKRKDRDVHRLVLIGIFQLWKDGSAPHAAIHENAGCARKIGKDWAVAVINAVLRRFQREQADWLAKLAVREESFAHPLWLLRQLQDDWPEDWEKIVQANNEPAPLWLRLNCTVPEADTVDSLRNAGFEVERHSEISSAIRISPPVAVESLPGFDRGRVSVQDPAAQLAAGLLEMNDGDRVLDACAAPGGKTSHILERQSGVDLTVLDRSPSRLEIVRENLDRLGFAKAGNVRLVAADASEPGDWWDGVPYRQILLDAPCTASGVIRRHPEIKWLRNPAQVREAVSLQARLLRELWPLLEVGGILLYATCSVLKAENSAQIQEFVGQHPAAMIEEAQIGWGRRLRWGHQLLPGEQSSDGFFYASLRKVS